MPLRSRLLWTVALLAATAALGVAAAPAASADGQDTADEMFFYRDDGTFRYYDIRSDGSLPSPVRAGSGFSRWDAITAVDLDGDGRDEMFFYREDGTFSFYRMRSNGTFHSQLAHGTGFSRWDAITAVDLDGDGRDEMFFYREDGTFSFYRMRSNGTFHSQLAHGSGYSVGWDAITAVDLDGNGRDEMFFYRSTDGAFRYYRTHSSGALGTLLSGGTGYSQGWDSISAIDLDGDNTDEMFFYREDGTFSFYRMRSNGTFHSQLAHGSGYSVGWDAITAVDINGDVPFERISRFTTYFDCCANRVTNIRRMAAQVNGHVVNPGETFSIDELIGPRTRAKGYLPAPYLQNGEGRCCAVGGGVSQFGTTIHNAVFWGGLDMVHHQPHSGWISRYPLGIEATLVYRSIDYRFTNDTGSPLTIKTSSTGTSLTVELWGYQGGWRVSGFHPSGARNSRVTVLDAGGSEAKRVSGRVFGSAPGTVRIVRTLTQNGVSSSETKWWHYVS